MPEGGPDVRDYDGAAASAGTGLYARFFRAMLDRGVALAPGPYEVAFPSMAHGAAEFDRTLACASEAIAEAARSLTDRGGAQAGRGECRC